MRQETASRPGGGHTHVYAGILCGVLAAVALSCGGPPAIPRGPGGRLDGPEPHPGPGASKAAISGPGTRGATPVPPPAASTFPSTFSIAARDPETGDLGVAVASRFFGVGPVVPWVSAGAGAIATQAYANTTYGPRGLALLSEGKSPEEVVRVLTSEDAGRDHRQLGVVDASGRAATYTGSACIPWAGGRTGPGYAVQGNILVGPGVVEAMARAYESARGALADRLLAALEAGERAGGDARGRQSAALYVARPRGGYAGFDDRYIRLEVADHPRPLHELRRLLDIRLGRDPIRRARRLEARGDLDAALKTVEAGLEEYPFWTDLRFEKARLLFKAGKKGEAEEALQEAVGDDPGYDHHHYRAALILLEAGEAQAALAALERTLKINPDYRDVIQRERARRRSPISRIDKRELDRILEAAGGNGEPGEGRAGTVPNEPKEK